MKLSKGKKNEMRYAYILGSIRAQKKCLSFNEIIQYNYSAFRRVSDIALTELDLIRL